MDHKSLSRSVLSCRVDQSPDGRNLPLYPTLGGTEKVQERRLGNHNQLMELLNLAQRQVIIEVFRECIRREWFVDEELATVFGKLDPKLNA